MVPIFPLALKASISLPHTPSASSVPEYPGAGMQVGTRVNAGNGGSGFSSSRAVSITANDLAVISTASTFTATALSNTTARATLGKLVGGPAQLSPAASISGCRWRSYAVGERGHVSAANTVLGSTTTAGRLGAASAGNSM